MTDLSRVPAGAGRTYHIQKTLGEWVESGEVAPGRILAVTFTEAAAAEMRSRVRGELMARERFNDALEIDHAYMGTIHALGQRLLTEHAFAAGRSPESRLLSEPERDLLIRLEMTRCAALQPLMQDLGRFGYSWDFAIQSSAEDSFRADLLRAVDLIRGLGARGQSPDILAPALQALKAGYGEVEPDGTALTTALQHTVHDLLAAFSDNLAPLFEGNASAVKDFSGDHRDLRRAGQEGVLERDWTLWQKLRALRSSKRGTPTPDGYDGLAAAVMEAADILPRHPSPFADAQAHLAALVNGAQEVLSAYEEAKRRAGLIGHADMIAEAEGLLRTCPAILQAVLGEIGCIVIDEFQDTNPVQFALLWRLARGAKTALIVGDTKQSIMGFQGADPRLSDALQAAHPETVTPLYRNWRSEARIMQMVNALCPMLFDAHNPLTPQRAATSGTALEVLHLPKGRKDSTAERIANRLIDILEAGTPVYDKTLKQTRPARPSDVAVLTNTHRKASAAAAALEAHGLPVRIQQDGWLTLPVMPAARAARAFAADSEDSHAALTWLTLGPPRVPLQDALRNASDGVLENHVSLEPLRALNGGITANAVAETVTAVLRAGNLRDWAAGLTQPSQAQPDLARREAEAQEFDGMAQDLRAAAGFHGAGMKVFLGWIAGQTAKQRDRHPAPDGWSSSGIEICTWHAAKDREWPITVVAGLDQTIAERLSTLRAEFAGFDDLDNVLDHAGLSYLPDFAAPESQDTFTEARRSEDERDAARKLYVALTRARDRLILVMPRDLSDTRRTPWRRIPSCLAAPDPASSAPLETVRLAEGVAEASTGSATERGTALHLAFRVMAGRPDLANHLKAATGLPDNTIIQIAAQAQALTRWRTDRGFDRLHFELPMQEDANDGSEINAILDCRAEGPHGLMIIDQKSGHCPDPAARFATYRPQLADYAAMACRHWPGKPLQGVAIHWMSEGTVSVADASITEPA